MIRKEILAKRKKAILAIEELNKLRFKENADDDKINEEIKKVRKKYNFYNNILKELK